MKTQEEDSVEALSWLETGGGKERTLSEDSDTFLNGEQALRLVRQLYAAGAAQVRACRVTVEYEFEDASSLWVKLPTDPAARAALFALEANALREMGSPFDPAGEQGQDSFGLGW